jgi:hypothetical protein
VGVGDGARGGGGDGGAEFISGYADSPPSTVGAVLCTNVQTGYTCEGVDVAEVHFRAMPEEVRVLIRCRVLVRCRVLYN